MNQINLPSVNGGNTTEQIVMNGLKFPVFYQRGSDSKNKTNFDRSKRVALTDQSGEYFSGNFVALIDQSGEIRAKVKRKLFMSKAYSKKASGFYFSMRRFDGSKYLYNYHVVLVF
jgi:hypothetical protein